ncbi:MAG: DNA repair protein RadC [Nanoarchaeota archaeon]
MIKDYPRAELPREKLVRLGPESLASSELIALILKTGTRGNDILKCSRQLICTRTLQEVSQMSLPELSTQLGKVKAMQLVAAFELGKRVQMQEQASQVHIQTSEDVLRLLQSRLLDKKKEHFFGLYLDARLNLIKLELLFIGTLNSSLVHPREIFYQAIKECASSIILCHNHPSGNPEPSDEDTRMTRQLMDASRIMGIDILDHVIIAGKNYLSMKEAGLL